MAAVQLWLETVLNTSAAWLLTYLFYSTVLLGVCTVAARVEVFSPQVESTLWRTSLIVGPVAASSRVVAGHVGEAGSAGPFVVIVAGGVGNVLISLSLLCLGTALYLSTVFWRSSLDARRRLLGERRPSRRQEDLEIVQQLARRAGRPVPEVTTTRRTNGPVAVGRREICIPETGFTDLHPDTRAVVMAHEIGHLARHDPIWSMLASSLERLFFFQPLHRIARHRLRECSELVADDFAIMLTGRPDCLVDGLIRIATPSGGQGRVLPTFSSRSLLLRRAARALDDTVDRNPGKDWTRLALAGAFIGLVWMSPAAVPAENCRAPALLAAQLR